MQSPPRDELGILPHDHAEILPEDSLVRYLRAGVNAHKNADGSWRISSGAFSRSNPQNDARSYASVDLERLMLEANLILPYRRPSQMHGIAAISVASVRDLNLQVGWVPLLENNSHCGIWGQLNNTSIRNKLAKVATLLLAPED